MKQLLIVKLLLYFGWLSSIAVAQPDLSGAITGFVNFPRLGITCIGNLAVAITSLLRKRLDLELGARDFLATITGLCKFREKRTPGENELIERLTIPGLYGNASVVMLSNSEGMANSSIRQFMEYIYNAHDVRSILLKYDIFKDPKERNCTENDKPHTCNCIVLRTVPEVTMGGMLKELPESRRLLPSRQCRNNGCHGCNRDLLHVEEIADYLNVEFCSAVCDALDFKFTTPTQKEPICICIPVSDDKWTKLLVRSFKYKDDEEKGAIVAASDALQSYLEKRGEDRDELVIYRTVFLIRFVEIFINLLLTGFFKVDGFSSSLAARRAVRSYVVDSKGNGLPANAFLTSALVVVKSDSVCQVLKFRGNILGSRTLLLIVSFVNLICALAWAAVLIVFNGGVGKWYEIPSMEPSKPRVSLIIAAIGVAIGMDCFDISKIVMRCFESSKDGRDKKSFWEEIKNINPKKFRKEIRKEIICTEWVMVLVVIVIEIVFAAVAGAFGVKKGIGRWVYGALQLLVWIKWGIGSCLLGVYSSEYVPTHAKRKSENGRVILKYSSARWVDEGTLVYSSSFFLNAVLAGVMGNWAGVWSYSK